MDKYFPIEDQIEMFGSALRGRVIAPRHADFDAVRQLAHGVDDRRPAAVVRVATAADVAAVINFARATDLEVAVRSGGHSVVGYSCTEGGIVIDMRDLNKIDIDVSGRTAWAGAGMTAGEVTAAVQQHGMIVGFGDSASVGISGLTLGGGIGYLVRKHGLTIDSLLAAEVVTATGEILIADETHHPDLFWGLRGGGGNFGVVTRLKYRLHPLPAFTGGPLILPATPEVLAGFVAAAEAAPDELSTIAMVMTAPPLPFLPPELHGKTIFMGMMAYAGGPEAAQKALAPFRALATPLADLVGPAPYMSMYIPEDPNMRTSLAIRTTFMDTIDRDTAARMLDQLEKSDSPIKMLQVRVLGGAMARVSTGATAFGHRNSRIMTAYLALFFNPADSARHDSWAADCLDAVTPGERAAYVNFVAKEGDKGVRAAYPAATLARLRQVKRQYDPENMFRLNQNITPA